MKMRKTTQWMALAATALLLTSATLIDPARKPVTYKVDPAKSELKWKGKKVTGEHDGAILLKSGSFTVDGNKLTGGSFVADMNSITCRDITDKEYNGKLIGHLKSDDFFGVESHPTAAFVVTKTNTLANGMEEVTGNLTIKGITKPVTFPVKVTPGPKGATVKGTIIVDRAKYDMQFRSKSFFDTATLGDKMVYDDFEIEVDLVSKK